MTDRQRLKEIEQRLLTANGSETSLDYALNLTADALWLVEELKKAWKANPVGTCFTPGHIKPHTKKSGCVRWRRDKVE